MSSTKTLSIILIAGAILALMIVATVNTNYSFAQNEKFKAKLTGKSEIPPVNTTATGKVNLKVRDNLITSRINITAIPDVKEAHIHLGNATENGDVIVDLLKTSDHKDKPVDMILRGSISGSDLLGPMAGKTLQDLQTAMSNEQTYVNIHTDEYPDGEIRGQIKVSGAGDNATKADSMSADVTPAIEGQDEQVEEEEE